MTQVKDKVQCLICLHYVALLEKYNIKRHYKPRLKEFAVDIGKLRLDELCQLEFILSKQKVLFTNMNKESEDALLAKYRCVLSETIARSSRFFTKGAFIKRLYDKGNI